MVNLLTQNFLTENDFGPKTIIMDPEFLDPKFVWAKKNSGPKITLAATLDQKCFWTEYIFCTQNSF